MKNIITACILAFVVGALVSGGVIYFVVHKNMSQVATEPRNTPALQSQLQAQSEPQSQPQPQLKPQPLPPMNQSFQNQPQQFQPMQQPMNQPQVSGLPMNPPQQFSPPVQGPVNVYPPPQQGNLNAPGPVQAGAEQLSQLLVSSAWCTMSYSSTGSTYATTGDRSSSTRIAFSSNGTFSVTTGGESHSSGDGGMYYGGSQGGEGGYWKVENGRLLMASNDTGGQFIDVGLQVTRNSSGYPILVADAIEYSMCQ